MNTMELLTLTSAATTFITAAGLILMFFIRDEKKNKIITYIMGIWAAVLAAINVYLLPSYEPLAIGLAYALGGAGIIGALLKGFGKTKRTSTAAKIMIAIAVVLGFLLGF